jgi:hypothetical protein
MLFFVIIFQNTSVLGTITVFSDDYSNYIHYTQSIWEGFGEEIMFRLVLFGLPMFVVNGLIFSIQKLYEYRSKNKSSKPEKSALERFVQKRNTPNPIFYLTGGWKRLDVLTIILMVFSSLSFAYIQIPYGWYPWKLIYSTILGLICGIAFCKYGLHAAIMINISTTLLMNWILISNSGLLLNSPVLVFVCLIFGSIMFLNLISLVLPKIFKLGSKLSN